MSVANAFHTNIALVLVKAESTPCVDAVPTPALNALLCQAVDFQPQRTQIDLTRFRDTHAAPGVAIGSIFGRMTLSVYLGGPSATPGPDLNAPAVSALLAACGYPGVATASPGPDIDTHTHAPDSTATDTVTIYVYRPTADDSGWKLQKLIGAVGDFSLNVSNGSEALWTFTMDGLYSDPADSVAPAGTAFLDEGDVTVARGHTISIGGRSDYVSEITIAANNTISPVLDMAQTYGVAGFKRQIGAPTIDHNSALVLPSVYDLEADVDGHTGLAFDLDILTIGGRNYEFSGANLQRGSFSYDRGSDVIRLAQTLYPRDSVGGSGDDAMTLVVT